MDFDAAYVSREVLAPSPLRARFVQAIYPSPVQLAAEGELSSLQSCSREANLLNPNLPPNPAP